MLKLYGEESRSVVKRGKWVWKTYKPTDPRGIWPGEHFWRQQLERRVAASREPTAGAVINPVRRWFPKTLTAVSRFVHASRPTTELDAEIVRFYAPAWIDDITVRNVIVGEYGPVLIDFCVNRV